MDEMKETTETKEMNESNHESEINKQTVTSTGEKKDARQAIDGKFDKLIFQRPDKLIAAGALLFGILFVWLFYGKYPGISMPIFVIAFYALLFAYTHPVLTKEAGCPGRRGSGAAPRQRPGRRSG
jgi:hypothetical protein